MEPPGAFTAREKKVKREKKPIATGGARRSDVDDVADLHATFFFCSLSFAKNNPRPLNSTFPAASVRPKRPNL